VVLTDVFLKEIADFEWLDSFKALTFNDMLSIFLSPWKEEIDGDWQN
jgi:hypothetical protein